MFAVWQVKRFSPKHLYRRSNPETKVSWARNRGVVVVVIAVLPSVELTIAPSWWGVCSDWVKSIFVQTLRIGEIILMVGHWHSQGHSFRGFSHRGHFQSLGLFSTMLWLNIFSITSICKRKALKVSQVQVWFNTNALLMRRNTQVDWVTMPKLELLSPRKAVVQQICPD